MCILAKYPCGQQCAAFLFIDFKFLIIFSEGYSSWGASLRSFSHPSLTHFFPYSSRYSHQHTVLKQPRSVFLSKSDSKLSHTHKTENINLTLKATAIYLARFRYSSVGIATRYGLGGPGTEVRWGRGFPHPSRPSLGPTQPLVQWITTLFFGGKEVGAWRWLPAPPHLAPRLKKD